MFCGDEDLARAEAYPEEYDQPAPEDEPCPACHAQAGQACRPWCPNRTGAWPQ